MTTDIQIGSEAGIVRVTHRGDAQHEATKEMSSKVAALAAQTQNTRLLFDVRGANHGDCHLGAIRHVEEAAALGIERTFRIAVFGVEGHPMRRYVEAVAVNRGFWVEVFTDEAGVVARLHSAPSADH